MIITPNSDFFLNVSYIWKCSKKLLYPLWNAILSDYTNKVIKKYLFLRAKIIWSEIVWGYFNLISSSSSVKLNDWRSYLQTVLSKLLENGVSIRQRIYQRSRSLWPGQANARKTLSVSKGTLLSFFSLSHFMVITYLVLILFLIGSISPLNVHVHE